MAKSLNFRTDSVLGNLPQDRQDQIAQWIIGCKEGDRYVFAMEQLAADGIKVTKSMVFDWFKGWRRRQSFSRADAAARQVEESLSKEFPNATPDKLRDAGQLIFTTLAMDQENPEEFREMEYLRLAKETAETKAQFEKQKIAIRRQAEARANEKLRFEREKFETDAARKMLDISLRKKAEEITNSNLSQADQIAAMRKAAFSEVDALQASGKVKIPKA